MAKEQGLSLNPTKISGACGRLMCCLKYEQETYEDLMKSSPKTGARVETPDGMGTVVSVALLRGMVKVRLGDGDESTLKDFSVSEIGFEGHSAQSSKSDDDIFADEDKAIMESLRRLEEPNEENSEPEMTKKPNKPKKPHNDTENQNENKTNKKPFKKRNFKKKPEQSTANQE
jgi:hypothetical protein